MSETITVRMDIPLRYMRSVQLACTRRNYQVNANWDQPATNSKELRAMMTITMPEQDFAEMLADYSRKDWTANEVV